MKTKIKKNILIILMITASSVFSFFKFEDYKSIPENPKLARIVRRELKKIKLTEQDLLSIKSIAINGKFGSANKLDGIERLQNLEDFELHPGKIDSIENLRSLKKLKYVWLKGNPITDLSPIADMELLELSIGGIKGLDFSPLQNMKVSSKFSVYKCGLKDLMQLKGITAEEFMFWDNDIEDFPEGELDWKNAKKIDLSINPISEFDKRDNWVNYSAEVKE